MFSRTWAASAILACGIDLATPAVCAESANLPIDQQATMTCMVSVLRTVKGVSNPKLVLSPDRSLRTFVTYSYHHRNGCNIPQNSSEKIEITEYIADKANYHSLWVSGLFSPRCSLNDSDSGIFDIIDGWRKECGVNVLIEGTI